MSSSTTRAAHRRAARAAARASSTDATFEVFCPGVLDVLSIGKGDLRLEVGTSDADRNRAKQLIGEMLEKGYAIFVETEDGPVRVLGFIASEMTYILPDIESGPVPEPVEPPGAGTRPKKKPGKRKVPVAGSHATAVGRTSGGDGIDVLLIKRGEVPPLTPEQAAIIGARTGVTAGPFGDLMEYADWLLGADGEMGPLGMMYGAEEIKARSEKHYLAICAPRDERPTGG